MAKYLSILNIFCIYLICLGNGERTKDKMYEQIDGASACFRRLNATHQIGCTSNRPGSTGVIHVINNDTDIKFILSEGVASPYVAVLPIDQLTPNLISKFKQNIDRISGIVVHKNITRPDNYTHEVQCPNRYSGLPNSCSANKPWNPFGTGILQDDIPFPIFLVQDLENLEKITNCFEKFNNYDHANQNLRSLCSLELASFMFATTDSPTCLRRSRSYTTFTPTRFCDPLASKNIWSSLYPWTNTSNHVSDVILVTAKFDTTSLFLDVTPGAVSPLTGLITLMSTAYLLKKMSVENEVYQKNIFFVLFNGETYDYIGSQRLVYDIINNAFPMKKYDFIKNPMPLLSLSDIKLIVELGQFNLNRDLFTHHIKYSKKDEIDKFKTKLNKNANNYNININQPIVDNNRLPPASLQSFLLEKNTIEGIVLTDHDETFTNHFYNSVYDDHDNIEYNYYNTTANKQNQIPNNSIQSYIANVSAILAKSLYEEATGKVKEIEDMNDVARIVDELFHCYLDTANCSIYQAVSLKEHIDTKSLSLYVSVDPHGNSLPRLTGFTLAWLTGDITNLTRDDCTTNYQKPEYQYVWMSQNITDLNATVCFRTTMNFSAAISPAFLIDDYDWSSGRYSSWTESVWNDLYVRMYLKPSQRHEIMTICVGTVTLVLSIALVYFVKTRSDILFAKPEAVASGTSC